MKCIEPFTQPVYITQPVLPDANDVYMKILEIWESRQLTNNGRMVGQLEEMLSRYLKVEHLSVFSNGTVALQIACRLLRLSGEVVTTPFTFAATAHSLEWSNLTPVFCDIEETSMNIDPRKIEQLITHRTTAVLPVHVFGYPCDVKTIGNIAEKYGLKIIYDAAHAFGVEIDRIPIGAFGDISMFSFHATKIYHTLEGGALAFGNNNYKNKATGLCMKNRADILRNFGISGEDVVAEPGTNGKMNELQAAIGILLLDKVDAEIAKRKELTCLYRNFLQDLPGLTFNTDIEGIKYNYPYFIIRVDDKVFGVTRDELYRKLKEYNIFAKKYFYPLCSDFACYRHLPSAAAHNLPVAAKVARQVLALPLHGSLANECVEKICGIIRMIRG